MWFWIWLGVAFAAGLLLGVLLGLGLVGREVRKLRASIEGAKILLAGREHAEASVPRLIALVQDELRRGSRLTRSRIVDRLGEELGHDPGEYWRTAEERSAE